MDRIFIDGTEFTDNTYGLENLKIKYFQNSNKAIDTGTTSSTQEQTSTEDGTVSVASEVDIRIDGPAHEYIKSALEDDCFRDIEVQIYKACCDETFVFFVDLDGYKQCRCDSELTLRIKDDDLIAFNCLCERQNIYLTDSDAPPDSAGGVFEWGSDDLAAFAQERLFPEGVKITVWANRCGLNFQSSILVDDPVYKNTILFYANPDLGTAQLQPPADVQPASNQHILSVCERLDMLSPVFNAEWRVRGGNLIFERVDFFDAVDLILGDLEELRLKGCIEDWPCCETTTDCAYERFAYVSDPTEEDGNLRLPQYNDIVEYNPDNSGNLTGECETMLERISPTFVQDDGDIATETPFGMSNFKLWAWDEQETAGLRTNSNCEFGIAGNTFNWPFFFEENSGCDGLYQRFHAIKRPGENGCIWQVEDFTAAPDDFCYWVASIKNQKINVGFTSEKGTIIPGVIEIDFDKQVINFSENRISRY